MISCFQNYPYLLNMSTLPGLFLFLWCIVVIIKIYAQPSHTDLSQILWGILLITSSVTLGFWLAFWGEDVRVASKYPNGICGDYMIKLHLYVELAKYIISFGFAAIGAGITANVLTDRFTRKKNAILAIQDKSPSNPSFDDDKRCNRRLLVSRSDSYYQQAIDLERSEHF